MKQPESLFGNKPERPVEHDAGTNPEGLQIEQPEAPLSNEALKEKHLEELYEQLGDKDNSLKEFEKDQESLAAVRGKLGMNEEVPNKKGDEINSKIEEVKEKILEAENDFLNLPEDIEEGKKSSIEEFTDSEKFKELQKEMDESIEEAREQRIEKVADEITEKYAEEFGRAANGKKAEKLFRKKWPIYYRENLEGTDEDLVTYTTFRFMTLTSEEGEDVFYVEGIDIENKHGAHPEFFAGKEDKGEKPIAEKENLDPELIGNKEKKEIGALEEMPENNPEQKKDKRHSS